jgi:uncharacterized protein YegP (UPF0339 family)
LAKTRPLAMHFEVYYDFANEWRWRLRARNGRIMADSGEGYGTKIGARNAIETIKTTIRSHPVDIYEIQDGAQVPFER